MSNRRSHYPVYLLTSILVLTASFQLSAQSTFIKASNADCLVWNPHPIRDEMAVIFGVCENGYLNGPSTVWWYRGNRLIQTSISVYSRGKENSDTKFQNHESGDTYLGKMDQGIRHGYGELHTKDYVYRGEFFNGKIHGKGSVTYTDGLRYSGDFFHGEWHGLGEVNIPGGGRYVGNLQHGKYHGEGILYAQSGALIGIGVFSKGRFVRLSDVYDKVTDQVNALPPITAPQILPPTFIEGDSTIRSVNSQVLNQANPVTIVLPSGRMVQGAIWSTHQQGTINGGTFLQIFR